MNHLINIAGITTIAMSGAIVTLIAAAINPIGAALIFTSVVTWIKNSQDSQE